MAASVGFLFLNNAKESFAPFCGFILYGSLLLVLLRAEGYLFEASTALAFLAIGVTAFNECCLFQDCENFTNDPPVQFLLVAALFSAMLLLRRRFLVHAARGVLPDQAAGERDWLHLLSADGPAIASLDTLACRLAQRCRAGQARHLDRQLRVAGGGAGRASAADVLSRIFSMGSETEVLEDPTGLAASHSIPGTADESRPVASLDRLYAQVTAQLTLAALKSASV